MAPFEALYGRACRSSTFWEEIGESQVLGPQRFQRDAELVGTIRRRMSDAQDQRKSYADQRRRPLEFSLDDHVFLRVSPTKGVRRFGLKDVSITLQPDVASEEVPVRILDRKKRQL
ncbi:uncharacterized protein LOC122048877 [Zingiber officinale]|uniref:uncharacterized protein LOC122048877 n=1 Tax=Zingiber officinale TaxID=94328 RepID=UPI001C4C5530|nr:uncharacterized protein LOC122048877 [Zingiber officinale]